MTWRSSAAGALLDQREDPAAAYPATGIDEMEPRKGGKPEAPWQLHFPGLGGTEPKAVPANPARPSMPSRCLTEEGCHLVPPRGVRSCIDSSCAAICCNVRSGAAALMPATNRTSLSSLV